MRIEILAYRVDCLRRELFHPTHGDFPKMFRAAHRTTERGLNGPDDGPVSAMATTLLNSPDPASELFSEVDLPNRIFTG